MRAVCTWMLVSLLTGGSGQNAVRAEGQTKGRLAECPARVCTGEDPFLTGLFPHPEDCSKFCHCVHGRALERTCPSNLFFNPMYRVCDIRSHSGCEQEPGAPRSATRVTRPKLPVGNPPGRRTSPPPVGNRPQCPSLDVCDGDDPYVTRLFPHPHDCRKYCHCADGRAYEKTCPSNLFFNPVYRVCDTHVHSGCVQRKIPSGKQQATTPAAAATARTSQPSEDTDVEALRTSTQKGTLSTEGSSTTIPTTEHETTTIVGTTMPQGQQPGPGGLSSPAPISVSPTSTLHRERTTARPTGPTFEISPVTYDVSTQKTSSAGLPGAPDTSTEVSAEPHRPSTAFPALTRLLTVTSPGVPPATSAGTGGITIPPSATGTTVDQVVGQMGGTTTSDPRDNGSSAQAMEDAAPTEGQDWSFDANDVCKDPGPTGLVPHFCDCTLFYVCASNEDKEPKVLQCPSGLHFNSDLGMCDLPKHAGCRYKKPSRT